MKDKIIKTLAIAIAVMGLIHIIATFTPIIGGELEKLTCAKRFAMLYMSLMCGALLVVCGTLVALLNGHVKEHRFLRVPYGIVMAALCADGIMAAAFMTHNPMAWVVLALVACLQLVTFLRIKDNKRQ